MVYKRELSAHTETETVHDWWDIHLFYLKRIWMYIKYYLIWDELEKGIKSISYVYLFKKRVLVNFKLILLLYTKSISLNLDKFLKLRTNRI